MGSFKAKIGWKNDEKERNKNYRSDSFLPEA